jgi:acetyl esterase
MGSLWQAEAPSGDARAVLMRQTWTRVPPPTVVSVAWHDPLHDEGVAYAGLLEQAGGRVTLLGAGDMAHGFLRQCRINTSARDHVERAADALLWDLSQADQ